MMIKYFYDSCGITVLGAVLAVTCTIVLPIALLFGGINNYTRWQCNNFEKVTGFEVKYINFDACYVKGSDGVFVRYDSKYKSIK